MSASPPLSDAALLERLVGFDTTSTLSNLPLAEFVSDYLDRPGVTRAPARVARRDQGQPRRHRRPRGRDGGEGSRSRATWTSCRPESRTGAPIRSRLTRAGDTYVGRGAADMKGFLALAINRLAGGRSRTPPPAARAAAHLRRGSGHPRRAALRRDRGRIRRAARATSIIGEPTSLRVVRLHKGMMRLQLDFHGPRRPQRLSASRPKRDRARRARHRGARRAPARRWSGSGRPNGEHFPEVPYAALNVGVVQGGSAANVIPDRCTVQLGIRLLPGMKAEDDDRRGSGRRWRRALPGEPFELTSLSESPAMMLDEDAALHRELCGLVGQHETESVAVRHRRRLAPARGLPLRRSSGRATSRSPTEPTSSSRSRRWSARGRCWTSSSAGGASRHEPAR